VSTVNGSRRDPAGCRCNPRFSNGAYSEDNNHHFGHIKDPWVLLQQEVERRGEIGQAHAIYNAMILL
jgi:hypothetical protein